MDSADKQIDEAKRLETVIDDIKALTGLKQDQIANEIGYKREYLSQAKKTGSTKLLRALETRFSKELENLTSTNQVNEPEASYETSQKGNDTAANDALSELIRSNRVLSESNKTLAEANLILARGHDELVLLAKQAFNISLEELKKAASGAIHQDVDGKLQEEQLAMRTRFHEQGSIQSRNSKESK